MQRNYLGQPKLYAHNGAASFCDRGKLCVVKR